MRVLAIIGSPKGKGNGYRVVQQIEKRMKGLGDVEFDYLLLKDANCYSRTLIWKRAKDASRAFPRVKIFVP